MKHGRTAGGETGAIHALTRSKGLTHRAYGALCGVLPTSPPDIPGPRDVRFTGTWHYAEEPVTCRRCLTILERLAEQALLDEAAVSLIAATAVQSGRGGSNSQPADPEKIRAFRRAWPAMGRAVADLLRHRGVVLGEGWLGPARDVQPR